MPLHIFGIADVSASVSRTGNAFHVRAPAFSILFQLANDVVYIDRVGVIIPGSAFVDGLSCGQHKIVADGRMSIGVVGSRYTVLGGQAIQERHCRIADDAAEVLIFFDHDEDVIEVRHLGVRDRGAD